MAQDPARETIEPGAAGLPRGRDHDLDSAGDGTVSGQNYKLRSADMRSMKPDRDICVRKIKIPSEGRNIPALVLSPKKKTDKTTGILWIYGGGYIDGMKEMVHMSRAVDLVKKYGAVVFSPGYRMAFETPYPEAINN